MTVPLTGGSPRQLVDCVWGFSVGLKGAYYYPCSPPEAAVRLTDVRLIDPASGQDRLIARLAGVAYIDLFWGPRVSPDGTTILYGRTVSEGEDLMVIENFN